MKTEKSDPLVADCHPEGVLGSGTRNGAPNIARFQDGALWVCNRVVLAKIPNLIDGANLNPSMEGTLLRSKEAPVLLRLHLDVEELYRLSRALGNPWVTLSIPKDRATPIYVTPYPNGESKNESEGAIMPLLPPDPQTGAWTPPDTKPAIEKAQ